MSENICASSDDIDNGDADVDPGGVDTIGLA